MTAATPPPPRDGEVRVHAWWCNMRPGGNHDGCNCRPAAQSEPPAELSDWERERRDSVPFLPQAETQQDDEHKHVWWNGTDRPYYCRSCGAPRPTVAARPSADTETLRVITKLILAWGAEMPFQFWVRAREVLDIPRGVEMGVQACEAMERLWAQQDAR